MIAQNASISDLVSIIRNRQSTNRSKFVLVLGSNYADTVNDFLAGVLNSDSPTVSQFISSIQLWSPNDKAAAIKKFGRSEKTKITNEKISILVREGYVSTIITTSCDTELEDALLAAGLKYEDFHVYVWGFNENQQLMKNALQSKDESVRVFKLYGSVGMPESIKWLPIEQNRVLDPYREELRALFQNDLILCGYVDELDNIGIAQFISANDRSSTWVVDEKEFDQIFQQSTKVLFEERLTSVMHIDQIEFFNTLCVGLIEGFGRNLEQNRLIDKYKADAKERLTGYASAWFDRFINLSLSAVPVKIRDMNRPYRTGETVLDAFDFKDALILFKKDLIAVLGEPGAGKTTLLQRQALLSLESKVQTPIFVELSNYQEERDLLELILLELRASGMTHEQAARVFSAGGFLLLLDGLNEVDEALMPSLARDIIRLYRLYRGANQFIVTCRTAEWPTILNKDCKRLEVLSVGEEEAVKYLSIVLGIDNQSAKQLFEKIDWGIRQLTHTPLILSMLASVLKTVFQEKDISSITELVKSSLLPQNKAMLYKQFLKDVLSRDLEENKSSIPIHLHEEALAFLARNMMNSTLTINYTEAEGLLCGFYEETQTKNAKYEISIETFLTDVMYTPPMITSKGSVGRRSHITFMHQSFQEYYTAFDLYSRLTKKNAAEPLKIMDLTPYIGTNDKRWWETIILLAGMFRDATELVKYVINKKNLYLAARCIRDSQEVSPALVDKIIVYGLDNFKYDANFDYDMIYSFNMVFHKASPNLPLRLLDDISWWLGKYAKGEPRDLQYLEDEQLLSCLDTKDESFLIDVVYTVGQRKLARALEPLLNLLFDAPENVRDQIVVAFGRIASPKTKEPLLRIVRNKKESPWIRAFALNSLGQLQDPDLIPELSAYLLDPSNPYRDSAAWAIRKINHPSSKQALLSALNIQGNDINKYSGKRYAIGTTLFALGDLGDATVVPYILEWAQRINDPFILEDTMYALGQLGDAQSIPFIISQLENSDAVVRKRAIDALHKLKAIKYVEKIRALLSDPSPFVQEEAEKTISILDSSIRNGQ